MVTFQNVKVSNKKKWNLNRIISYPICNYLHIQLALHLYTVKTESEHYQLILEECLLMYIEEDENSQPSITYIQFTSKPNTIVYCV